MRNPKTKTGPYYLTPLENLEDLFLYLGGALKREPFRSGTGLRLSAGTPDIRFVRTVEGSDIRETLVIRRSWEPGAVEQIELTLAYVEPKQWEAALKEEMKRDPGRDRFYRDFKNMRGKNQFLSHEMFVDSTRCSQWLGCKLNYKTGNLGRGLRSLAKLKIYPQDTVVEGDASLFQALYEEMEKIAEKRLAAEFGPARAKWRNALRRRPVDVPGAYKKIFENASPPALLRDYIVQLCKIYAADDAARAGVAGGRRPGKKRNGAR